MAQFDPVTGERIDVKKAPPVNDSAPSKEQSTKGDSSKDKPANPEPEKGESGPQKGGK